MKKTISLILISVLWLSIFAQEEYLIESDFRLAFADIEKDNNGDFVALYREDSLNYHWWGGVVKFDSDFNHEKFVWKNDTMDIRFQDILITEDNDYILAGSIGSDSGEWYYTTTLFFMLIDEDLNVLSKHFLQMPDEYFIPYLKMFKTTGNRYYVIVHQQSAEVVFKAYIELSDKGEVVKQEFYDVPGIDMNPFQKPGYDNGFYVLQHSSLGYAAGEIIDVDTNLNYTTNVLPLTVNGELYDIGSRGSCKWLNDSTYILITEGSSETPGFDLWLYKMNSEHEFISEPFLIGRDSVTEISLYHRGMDFMDPNTIYIAGNTVPVMSFPTTYYVAIINEDFEVLGAKSYGSDNNTFVNSMLALEGGGCVMVGGQRDYIAGDEFDWNGYIVFIEGNDIITSAAETKNPYDSDYILYPNPGKGKLVVQTARKGTTLKMYDQSGKLVLSSQLQDKFRNIVDTSPLKSGIYQCLLTDKEGNIEQKKWIKH